jgi:hypothetical protein
MYLVSPITTTKPLYQHERQFAVCESCFWCATVFQRLDTSSNNHSNSIEQQQKICPLCKNKSISLVPLAKDEVYTIAMEGKRGLEIEFSKHRR